MTGTTHIPLQRGIDDCITGTGSQRRSQMSLSSNADRNPDLIPTSSSSSKGKLDTRFHVFQSHRLEEEYISILSRKQKIEQNVFEKIINTTST